MKVFSAKEMQEIENKSFKEGYSADLFMENVGVAIANAISEYVTKHNIEKKVLLLCAKGNNTGDAYVAGRCLIGLGFKVTACQTLFIKEDSLAKDKQQRFLLAGGQVTNEFMPPKQGVILDGLFGTGFRGALEEPILSIVKQVNQLNIPKIAIDIPSGLNGDTGVVENEAIVADVTLYLSHPKTGFFMNQGWKYVGHLQKIDFGLPDKFVLEAISNMEMITKDMCKSFLPKIARDWHKYIRGYLIAIAGSKDMPGAAILSSHAAMRAGTGIMRLITTEAIGSDLVNLPPEIIRQVYEKQEFSKILEKASAIYIGPGIGRSDKAVELLKEVLKSSLPTVIDADALFLLSKLNVKYHPNIILTPHHGEMMQLLHLKEKPSFDEFFALVKEYVNKHNITLVLKGAPTFILTPSKVYVNVTGNPGMATAGSGDVLTGIIASFLAQKAPVKDAACLGVYLHGLAGDIAAEKNTMRSLLASDIIECLPESFKELS